MAKRIEHENESRMKKSFTQWFIEPLDEHTNQSLAKELAQTCDVETHQALLDNNNKPHKVYEVKWRIIDRLLKDPNRFNFKFNLFKRQLKTGPIYDANFMQQKKKKKFKVKQGSELIEV